MSRKNVFKERKGKGMEWNEMKVKKGSGKVFDISRAENYSNNIMHHTFLQ